MRVIKKYTINQSACILNEFYSTASRASTAKGLRFKEYKKKILAQLRKIIENNGFLYTNDEEGLFRHMMSSLIKKNKKTLKLPESLNLTQNFRKLMQRPLFKELYYSSISLIFSCEISEISNILNIKCCLNPLHYSFCKGKWESLYVFTQQAFLNLQQVVPLSKIRPKLAPFQVPNPDNLLF